MLDTAEKPDKTLMFKYASHALNNSFFLNCLVRVDTMLYCFSTLTWIQRPPTGESGERVIERSMFGGFVRKQFGDFDALRSQFSAAVYGMSGSGYVWFVADEKRNVAFYPTFSAGTLLVRSRSGTVDPLDVPVLGEGSDIALPNQRGPNQHRLHPSGQHYPQNAAHLPSSGLGATPTSPASGASHNIPPHHPSSPSRTLHSSVASHTRSLFDSPFVSAPPGSLNESDMRDLKTLGEYIYPLFCVSVHEHCWLLDHGIWGKEEYMKAFWSVLDWQQVVQRFETFHPPRRS